MTATHGYVSRLTPLWVSAWPVWAVVLFAALVTTRDLPAGYARAVIALPILLLVPGALTVCALFGPKGRPRGTTFLGYAAMLSLVWLCFASLALYILHILITAGSTYSALLVVCAVLATVAEARLLRERETADSPVIATSGSMGGRPGSAGNPRPAAKTPPYAVAAAVVAGFGLLCGGVYFYDRLPHPVPGDYTQLAWTRISDQSTVAVGPSGVRVSFKVTSQEPTPTHFRLSSEWEGMPARPLSKPVTFTLDPNKTLTGMLLVPPPADQCTYRIVLTLVAVGERDPLTAHQPTSTISANVHKLDKSGRACST
jgi:hypothetical protein